ncbi:MAG: CaiB/BaiF CoA-transferase family protein [Acidimicrobiales bacterium]
MGVLDGVRVVEIAGIGPGPFCAMMLADAGADVVRVDRASAAQDPPPTGAHDDILNRSRRSVAVDLKKPEGVETVLRLVDRADVFIEGFRPGVAERLGIGPDVCLERRPSLVYGRMTGWGQSGPYAAAAGHDIDYIALSGALGGIGRAGETPVPPLNLVGDFGGGGMLLAFGVVAALVESRTSGQGQVVDAAMVDGAALLSTMIYGFHGHGQWGPTGTNLLDTGAWFYEVYECADGRHVAVGAIEPQFCAELVRLVGLDAADLPDQNDPSTWPEMKDRLAEVFATRTRAEWCEVLEGTDACFAPVLSWDEAPRHPHNVERGTFVEVAGITQPGPAPRFSRTPSSVRRPAPHPGRDTDEALADWGFAADEVAALRDLGAVR